MRWPGSPLCGPGCTSVLAVGQSLPFRRGGSVSLPLDVSRTLEELLDGAELDFVHVHEPFAPSASSAALRHSHALNVGTFHASTERFVSTQVARRMVELLFGRLDGRTASYAATRDLVERYFPGDYRVIHPGADLLPRPEAQSDPARDRLLGRGGARRAAAVPARAAPAADRRGLARDDLAHDPAAAPALTLAGCASASARRPADGSEAQHLPRDDSVAASAGTAPAPQLVLRCMAGGACRCVAAAPVRGARARRRAGPLFRAARRVTLPRSSSAAHRPARWRLRPGHRPSRPSLDGRAWPTSYEDLYERIAARRRRERQPQTPRRLAERDFVHVDLHMHTDHSPDCATPVPTLLETAEEGRAGRDRDHRPQRDLGRARGARAGRTGSR
jgi:hypothetical protein